MRRRGLSLPLLQVVVLLTLPLVAYLGFSAAKKGLEAYSLWRQADALRGEIEQLKARNAELRQQIEYLRSDTYVEKVAREELDMVKPGDVPIVVVYPTPSASPAPATPTPTATPRPAPWGWLDSLSAAASRSRATPTPVR